MSMDELPMDMSEDKPLDKWTGRRVYVPESELAQLREDSAELTRIQEALKAAQRCHGADSGLVTIMGHQLLHLRQYRDGGRWAMGCFDPKRYNLILQEASPTWEGTKVRETLVRLDMREDAKLREAGL